MKHILFLLLLSIFVTNLHAQLLEQFADGDFSSNPQWLGNTGQFIINTKGELQLNDTAPVANNTTYLVTNAPVSLNDSTTWECSIRLEFATSTTNFARVYLLANQANLTGNLNGYFLKIGGISGNTDALELYRQDGSNTTLLLAGTTGAVGGDSVAVRIRVTRSTTGNWTLLADYQGGTNFQSEGSIQDVTYPTGDFFGFYCRYTATRNKAFFFDDVYINPLFADKTPPTLLNVNVISSTQVEVTFDEPLDVTAASNAANYTIEEGIGNPVNVVIEGPDKILLTLNNPLQSAVNYTLSANNIADLNGNKSNIQSKTFIYYDLQPAAPGDVIITEIFPDPTPTQGLPEAEFVELYNRSDKVIQLQDFGFSAGGPPQRLPAYLLLPGAYVILCDDGKLADFQSFGTVIVVGSFPALTNSGDDLTLTDATGQVLFSIVYSDSWYQSTEKKDGGWTLELIDLTKNPYCEGNWRASISPNGGTPGAQNSLFGMDADNVPPRLSAAIVENETTILLTFSENLDPNSAENPANYSIDNITVSEAFLQTTNQVLLYLATPLQKGQLYTVMAKNQIKDCLGNGVGGQNSLQIGVAEALQPGDLVLNEILFNPYSGGSDFIELYNISNKILNLKGLQILNNQKTGSTASRTITTDFLLLPESYVAISENAQDLRERYNPPADVQILNSSLPALDDNKGNVTLRFNGNTIDSFDYSENLHFALLSDKEGVSLERISFTAPTPSTDNWHSAAASVLFATPGYRNSQFFETMPTTDGIISIANKTFSPDGDGVEDFLLLDYHPDQAGLTANIRIFDVNGRLVKKLAQNILLAAQGNFKWDGVSEDGSKARIGIYVVWVEVFTANGKVTRQKLTCILAGKLN